MCFLKYAVFRGDQEPACLEESEHSMPARGNEEESILSFTTLTDAKTASGGGVLISFAQF